MVIPKQRITITLGEYKLLKPGLDLIANGLATARLGSFPKRFALERFDKKIASLYAGKAFDEEMAQRLLSVRGKLWELTVPRKIRVDEFEIRGLGLALRLNRAPGSALRNDAAETTILALAAKLERFRKRAKLALIARFGKAEHQEFSDRWKAHVAWTRHYTLPTPTVILGTLWRAQLWRNQREELTEALATVVKDNFFEPLAPDEIVKMATLAASTFRRSRRAVGLRDLLKAPGEHAETLLKFVTTRATLKKRPDAPKSLCERLSDNGEKFMAFRRKARTTPKSPAPTVETIWPPVLSCRTTIVAKPVTILPSRVTAKIEKGPEPRSPAWEQCLRDFIGQWFLHTVEASLRREVCEQAQYLIGGNLLEQFRRPPTVATTFSAVFAECRPSPEEEPINWFAAWVLSFLLALGRTPGQVYTDVQLGFGRAEKIVNA